MKWLAFFAVVLVAAGCGSTKTVTVTSTQTKTVTTTQAGPVACTASDLSASFNAQPGSAGAGNITYVLKLTNTSATACVFTPSILQLLDAKGGQNPTHAQPASVPKTIAAGASASYEARFSPDVPGTGDNTTGACEPVSSTLQVTVGSGTVNAPIKPPTSVCEQGSMQFRPPTP